MKKTILICAAALLTVLSTVNAQTNTNTNTVTTTNTVAYTSIATELYSSLKSSGLSESTNYAIVPYLTYAPKLANGKSYVGGGILAIYNLNNYVGAGIGLDYLGQFSLISGNLSLKYPISAGKYAVEFMPSLPHTLTNLLFIPFVLGGLGKPVGGTGNGISTVEDAGAYIQYGNFLGGKFNTGACYGQWNNAGDYSGKRYHIFAGWSRGF